MKGVGAYQAVKNAVGGVDLRRVEAEALLKIARAMEEGQGEGLDSVKLRYQALLDNVRLWRVFFEDCKSPENGLPEALRTRLLGLALWVVGRSEELIGGEGSLAPLVDINRMVARGLLGQQGGDAAADGGQVSGADGGSGAGGTLT